MKRVVAKTTPAFTRIELFACLTVAALVASIFTSALAFSSRRGDRVACFNNLRQIGAAYSQFGLEHENLTAWSVPRSSGGNQDSPLKNNAFVQFSVLSNFIASPKLLLDPADDRAGRARPATSWGNSPQGGLWNPNFGNNSISYFLGLDGNFNTPASLLSGDRNLKHEAVSSCSSGIAPAAALAFHSSPSSSWASWTNAVHGLSGNILAYDGTVHEVDTPTLRKAIFPAPSYNTLNTYHILLPF